MTEPYNSVYLCIHYQIERRNMEQLVRMQTAQTMFSLSRVTLNEWVEKGLITDYRTPGGHRRFDPAEIEGLLRKDNGNGQGQEA